MCSVVGATEVDHTIETGERGTTALPVMGVDLLFGQDVSAILRRVTVSSWLDARVPNQEGRLHSTSQEKDTMPGRW